MEQMTMEQMEMEQMFPRISSNSPSIKTENSGTLCSASKQSGNSTETSTSSAGSRRSVNWYDSSSSSYDADDERNISSSDSEADDSEQSDGPRPPSPILNEQGVTFFIRNETAKKEMGLYNLRKKKKDAAARMRRLELGQKLKNQWRISNFTQRDRPEPYYHPSNYVDRNAFRSPLAELKPPLTGPMLEASDAPSTPRGRSNTRLFFEHLSP